MAMTRGREKSLERQLRAFHWVRVLAEIPGRLAGTESERVAAQRVQEELQEIGFEQVSLDPITAAPAGGLVLGLHLGLAALGCWVGGGLGALLAGVAAWSFHSEFRLARPRLSRWLRSPASQNVVARAGAQRPRQRVILSAHLDAAQAGWIFSEELANWFAGRTRVRSDRGQPPLGPHALPELLILLGASLALASWLGAGGVLVGLARFALGSGLAVGAALMLQWAFAHPSPGANDNASAVAAMLTCGEQLLASLPEDTELWLVGTGAEEVGCSGMRAFCDAHDDWPRDSSYFVNFECVGGGELHWVRSEGTLPRTTFPPLLTELARRVAASGAFGDLSAVDLTAATDGNVPARLGFATISLIALEANGVPRNYHRHDDTPEALDMETVVRAADFGAAVARVALQGEAGPIAIV